MSTGLLGNKRRLILAPDYLEYENSPLQSSPFTRINKEDIVDIKHDLEFILWYRFYVGCDFTLDVKSQDGHILSVRFKSYFSKNDSYREIYAKIVDIIWDYYLSGLVEKWKERLFAKKSVELKDVLLTEEGVFLLDQQYLIYWEDVEVKEYNDYYAVFSKSQPVYNKILRYNEWGSEVLYSLATSLTKGREEKE
ncbi:hypothetical protein [Pontibacter sp. SGAir0037]|uniref:hypothetical protein n=1 Tax=Pontibacter sp. SGAir0037 TaxID=2571030 RepID=UPI0010F99BFA|nr:hypothetical protein [Pontibacter sp. SGAir0037]